MVATMNSTANRDDWVGRTVDGRFPLLQWLGGSEESSVYLTELPGDGAQKGAIKLIPAKDAEIRIAGWAATATLAHPHLMRLLYSGRGRVDEIEVLYAVTEYAEENLSQVLPERSLTPAEAKEMLEPVLDSLAYLHRKGFAHGRLKPSNILVVGDQVKLSCDSLLAAGGPRSSLATLSVYDAPERANGAVSEAADVWSLGVTLVEALTQHAPLWDREAQSDPIVPNSIPQPFADIARQCLRSDLARRCSLTGVGARLNPTVCGPVEMLGSVPPEPPRASISETPEEMASAAPGRSREMTLAAVFLVLIAVVVTFEVRSHKTHNSTPNADQRSAPAMDAAPADSAPSAAPPVTSGSQGTTAKGEVAERVMPDVSPSAIASIHGQLNVRVRLDVDSSGNVSNATLDAAGPSRYFARVAMEAAPHWRFKPAQVGGRAVPSVWTLKFEFKRGGVDVTPVEKSP